MLRQTKWGLQDGLIAKNGVLPVTNSFFFENFCFKKSETWEQKRVGLFYCLDFEKNYEDLK